jgi:hypothetical protein
VGSCSVGRPNVTFGQSTEGFLYDGIATVTVYSGIYREYLHLVQTADGWKILNALYTRVREDPISAG